MADGILGLGSGQATTLNSDLIDKLKTAERKATVEPIETKITKISTEKETFSSIEEKVNALLEAIKPFDLFVSGGVTAFEQKSATTSGDSVTFDAADVKSLNKGTTSVEVTQLAQKDVFQSNAVTASTKDATMSSLGDLVINGTTFTTEGKTYKQLADEITAQSGMNASIEAVGTDSYRLVIKSEESGTDNKLNISGYAASALGFDTKDVYQSNAVTSTVKDTAMVGTTDDLVINGIKFTTNGKTYQELADEITAQSGMNASIEQTGTDSYRLLITAETSGTSLTISGAATSSLGLDQSSNHLFKTGSHVLEAQNMISKVDGVTYDVSTNSITVDGLKITANKTGTSSITVVEDNTSLETQMNTFVTKYNELVALIDTESQSADSALGDKSTIRDIVSQIKNKLFGSYGSTGNEKSIFNYGFELDKYGSLSLDSTQFNKMIQENISDLKDLFSGTAENKGLGTILKETLDSMTFTGGLLDTYEKAMLKRETNLNDEKDKAQTSLDNKYKQLALQFSAYGTIITQMESSFSGLKMLIQQSTASN